MIRIEPTGPRIKVAIIGGGIGGLTTALELTATEELRARYDVTIYQMGWRLGGKCATGRNADEGQRIEEHGLHLWFGGYDNAFSLLHSCYQELDRPATAPIHSIADAFEPLKAVTLYDWYQGAWSEDYQPFPIEPGTPWDSIAEPRFWDMIVTVVDWMRGTKIRFAARQHLTIGDKIRRAVGDVIEDALNAVVFRYIDRHRKRRTAKPRAFHWSSWLLRMLRSYSWRRRRNDLADADVRHRAVEADARLSCLIGMIDDEVIFRGFDAINGVDFVDWLRTHGAQPETLQGTAVRVTYDQCFAGNLGPRVLDADALDAEVGKPAMAAGAALYSMVRTSLPWRGSTMWRARAGMGDTVIAPMYEVLAKRQVKVEFFRRVEDLRLGPDGTTIEEVVVRRQAEVVGDGSYRPLIDVKGLACWPNQPEWDQLVDGAALRSAGTDFESDESAHLGVPQTLRRGEDFDVVVLAASAAALPPMCGELVAASPAFAAMLRETRTTMTQAFQLWLKVSPGEVLTDPRMPMTESLGYRHGRAATSTFVEPLDTGCDMAQVLPFEDGAGTQPPRSVWYFCGVLPDAPDAAPLSSLSDADQRARAHAGALDYLTHIGAQWPLAVDEHGFRWEVLAGPDDVVGEARFERQYWRANCSATERYVQTPPGSVDSRLKPDGSDFSNLLLAGDWTKNGFDIGAVEATVMSGMLASRALCGSPKRIAWENHEWLIDS